MSSSIQVLNQLEKRGVRTLSGQAMVRSVPPWREYRQAQNRLLVLGRVRPIGALAWQWLQVSRPDAAAKKIMSRFNPSQRLPRRYLR